MGKTVINVEIWIAIAMMVRAMVSQVGHVTPPSHIPIPAARVRDFAWMNPLEFCGSKLDENGQEFIDEIYKMLDIREVSLEEKAKLAVYQ